MDRLCAFIFDYVFYQSAFASIDFYSNAFSHSSLRAWTVHSLRDVASHLAAYLHLEVSILTLARDKIWLTINR